jgi:serine/threonine-protein kinase
MVRCRVTRWGAATTKGSAHVIGSIIDGRYKVLGLLGEGGMGKVFEAQHTGTGRIVAVKVILSEALNSRKDLVARFHREARTAGTIDTKHIVEIIDTGTDPATRHPYMAMELMKGDDCSQLVRRVGPLPPLVALRIAAQACVGLKKAHDAGVIHRDIKPANLFLAERDEGEITVKILDFGIAKVMMDQAQTADNQLTQTGAMMGSPLFMSPEQARGSKSIDHRADIWSLGVVLYQLLCGRTPYHHIEALGELIIAICGEPPPSLQQFAPWVDPEVAGVVHAALIQDPDGRFQTADDMLTVLKGLLPGGYGLRASELIGVAETAREFVAEKIDPQKLNTGSELAEAAKATIERRATTDAGLAATHVPTSQQAAAGGTAKWVAVALGAILGAGGLYAYLRPPAVATVAPAASATVSVAPSGDSLTFSKAAPLVIMADSFSGYSTFRSDGFVKTLGNAKIALSYVEHLDQKERASALASGKADLIATTLDHVLLNRPKGKIVALIDTTVGADAMVLNNKRYPQLKSLAALQQLVEKNKLGGEKAILSYAAGTPSEFLARLLSARLDSFNIDDFKIDGVDDAAIVWQNLTAPNSPIAAAVLWEPFVTKARDAGYPVVLSSGDVPGAIQDVLVASDRFILRAPRALQTLVSAYYRYIDRATVNPTVMVRQVAQDGKLTEKDAKAVVTGIRFATSLTAKKAMQGGKFVKRIKATASVLVIDGGLDQPPKDPTIFFDARFVAKAADNTRKLIAGLEEENPKAAKLLAAGGEQNVTPKPLDASQLADATVIGQLGQLSWAPSAAGVVVPDASIENAATKLEDFSHVTTVVVLEGGGGDAAKREALRAAMEKLLRRRGLMHQVAVLAGTGAGPVSVRLRRRPGSQNN